MRKKRILSYCVVLLALTTGLNETIGQGVSTNNNILYNKAPELSSPNAASLAKYVEFPTATYTGVPEISILLYSIGIKGVQVPIGLSYHAGGIKVDDVSSDVGTGWSLMAGGAVSIMRNGLIDEMSGFPDVGAGNYTKVKNNTFQSGYTGGVISCNTAMLYNDPITDPNPYGLYAGGDITLLGGVIRETHDLEPDVYSFHFPGKSGKFFMDESGIFRTIPYSEVKVERLTTGGFPSGYKITDEGGNVFEFTTREESTEMQTNAASTFHPSQKLSRTYYLSKIINLVGEEINFYYSSYNYNYNLQNTFSRSRTSSLSSCWQMNTSGGYFNTSWTYGNMTVMGQRIDSIRSTDGTLVKFSYSGVGRTDLPGTKALSKIEVWQYLFGRKKIREVTLSQGYSGGRMILNSVQEAGMPATTFTYKGDLPARLSYSQDHYGYHNAKTNFTLLPSDEYMEFPDGADRSVDTAYVQDGILKRINHPTGGYTEYLYEPNDYYVSTTTTKFVKTVGATKVSQPNQTVSGVFSVPSNATKIKMVYTNSYDGTQIHNDYCIIHLTGPNGYSQDFVGNSLANAPFLTLAAGQYTLSIENVGSTYTAEATISWFQETQVAPHSEFSGGVRIKEIRKYEANSVLSLSRKFEYTRTGSSQSSGIPQSIPSYISYTDQTINQQASSANPTSCSSVACQLIMQSSNSVAPIIYANGSSVLYDEVISYNRDKVQNGYTYFKFNVSQAAFNPGIIYFPYAPRVPYDWVNGSLLEQHDYAYQNSQYILVKKVKNYYNYDEFNPSVHTNNLYTAYAVKVGITDPPFICWSVCQGNVIGTTISSIAFGLQPYKLYSSWHKLIKAETTIYSLTGTQPFTTTVEYFNDNVNSIQVSRVESKTSDGRTLVQRTKYAKDYNNYGFVNYLLSKNVLSVPVEQYQSLKDVSNNESVTGGQITTFKANSILPDKVYGYETYTPISVGSFAPSVMNSSGQLIMDAKYKEKVSFNVYNSIGNLMETQRKDDISKSYLWGYAGARPVAQIVNAKPNEVFFDSFEELAGWETNLQQDNTFSHAGQSSGKIVSPSAELISHQSTPLTIALTGSTKYKLSGWVYSNGPSADIHLLMKTATETGYYTSADLVTTSVTNKWTYLEKDITVPANITSLRLRVDNNGGGTVWFDDLRVYPAAAQMTSFTYDPLVGMTSQADINNRFTFYEYDALGRLTVVRDNDRNVLKKICYNYAGQPEECGIAVYYSIAKSGTFTRNNCGTNGTGASMTYTVAAGTYTSTVDQATADQLAQDAVNANGQAYANANAGCTWTNQQQSSNFTRNNCGTNGTGTTVTYTVNAGTYSSTTSLADANQQAVNYINANGQAYANTNGTCSWTNQQQSSSFTRNNCGTNGTGGTMTYTVNAGTYTSTTSLADANQQAINYINANGQNYVNANAGCTWTNQAQSGNFTRNNCAANYIGTTVTYTIAAGTYSSTTSLAHANTLAVNAVNSGGQAYANANGTCVVNCATTCVGNDKKCIDNVCTTGTAIEIDCEFDPETNKYKHWFAYRFPDGSWSAYTYYVIRPDGCSVE